MKLYFQNSKGEERVIAEPTNKEAVSKEIYKFLDNHNDNIFKSYYTRAYVENGRLKLDVESHTEFFSFYLERMTYEEYVNK